MLSAFQDATWQAIAWTLVVFLAGFILGRRDRGRRDLSGPPQTSGPPQMSAPPLVLPPSNERIASLAAISPETRTAIATALAAGRKIEAIKILREATGMGLRESKEAVEDGRI